MPELKRLTIIKDLRQEHIPTSSSAFVLCKLETMQGAVFIDRGDRHGALECYQRGAHAFYAAQGEPYLYAKELWRVVGAAIGCGNRGLALETLQRIRNLRCFQSMEILKGSANTESNFVLLTNVYAGPWWKDDSDPFVASTLTRMARETWRGHAHDDDDDDGGGGDASASPSASAAGQTNKSSSNKKKRGGKKKR